MILTKVASGVGQTVSCMGGLPPRVAGGMAGTAGGTRFVKRILFAATLAMLSASGCASHVTRRLEQVARGETQLDLHAPNSAAATACCPARVLSNVRTQQSFFPSPSYDLPTCLQAMTVAPPFGAQAPPQPLGRGAPPGRNVSGNVQGLGPLHKLPGP
jgi:hypothetical protein